MGNVEFAQILRRLIDERMLTQLELAKRLGIMQSQVSNWLYGKSLPGYNSLRELSRVFGVDTGVLLGLHDGA